jgi:hypothetical protein
MTGLNDVMDAMTARRPWKTCRSGLLAVLAVLVLGSPSLRGEDDTVVDDAARRASEQVQQPQQVMLEQQMNGMFFAPSGNEEKAVQQCLGRLLLEVSALDEVCGLSDLQRLKCETAARLDVAQAMDDIDTVRRRYVGRTINLQDPAGQQEWQRFLQEAQAMQAKLQDVGGETSLTTRVIAGVLDDTQRSVWRRESELRKLYQWQSVVDAGMAQIDIALGLSSEQHDAMHAILMEKPLRINPVRLRMHGNHFAPFVCKYALSRIDQKRLAALINERQQKTLRQFIDQGKGMTVHLKQQRILFE